jgi:hypothetical protein
MRDNRNGHGKRVEERLDERDAERRDEVNAADDTGLVRQQEILHEVELPEGEEIPKP